MNLAALGRVPHSDMHGHHIFDATRAGLWPFRPRMIEVWMEFDIDFNRYVIFVEARFGDERIAKRKTIDAFDLADDIDGSILKVSQQFFEAFRNRGDYPIPAKITLGEN